MVDTMAAKSKKTVKIERQTCVMEPSTWTHLGENSTRTGAIYFCPVCKRLNAKTPGHVITVLFEDIKSLNPLTLDDNKQVVL